MDKKASHRKKVFAILGKQFLLILSLSTKIECHGNSNVRSAALGCERSAKSFPSGEDEH